MVAPSKGHPGHSWSQGLLQVKHKDLLLRTQPLGGLSLNNPFTPATVLHVLSLCRTEEGNPPQEKEWNAWILS